jgi:ubiquitin-conjugating enzyme E2 variant
VGVGGILVETFLAVVFVDFCSGVLHWLEDAYGSEKAPIIGRYVTTPNIRHHVDPMQFTHCSIWLRNRVTWTITLAALAVVAALGAFSWFWASAGSLGLLSNEIHCWWRRSPAQNGPVVGWLQRARLIQSPLHHARHHRGGKNTRYCVVTDFVNPVLDRVDFFPRLERIIARFGVPPRPAPSVRQLRAPR